MNLTLMLDSRNGPAESADQQSPPVQVGYVELKERRWEAGEGGHGRLRMRHVKTELDVSGDEGWEVVKGLQFRGELSERA